MLYAVFQTSKWVNQETMIGVFLVEEDAEWFVDHALKGTTGVRIKEVPAWEQWSEIKKKTTAK